jgi:nitrogen fixation protein NifU and related proteins
MNDLLHDPLILRQIIMDHYEYPHNHQLSEDPHYGSVHMASESCIDDITVQALIKDGKIDDVRFDGVACTISTASTSIMSELLIGKTLAEAQEVITQYNAMINMESYDENVLEEAVAFHNVGRQANRIKCATIGWKAIVQLIDESGATHD